jgi:nicotinamidase/pyrazinamidase
MGKGKFLVWRNKIGYGLIPTDNIASLEVDPQKGFSDKCPNELPVLGAIEIVPELNAQAEIANKRIFSKDAHSASNAIWAANKENPQFSKVDGKYVDVRWNLHCVPGTEGFELLDGLPEIDKYDFHVYKGIDPSMHPYGACYHEDRKISTGLIEYCSYNQIEYIIVGGLATDYCVKLTVLQLLSAGFGIILNLGACRGLSAEGTQQAIEEMKNKADQLNARFKIINTVKELDIRNNLMD